MSVGIAGTFLGKSVYPGSSYKEVFGVYPTWADRYLIYDNANYGGLSWDEQKAKAESLGGRLLTQNEIIRLIGLRMGGAYVRANANEGAFFESENYFRLTACYDNF